MKLKAIILSLVGGSLIASGIAWYFERAPVRGHCRRHLSADTAGARHIARCGCVVAGLLGACRQVWAGGRQHQRHGNRKDGGDESGGARARQERSVLLVLPAVADPHAARILDAGHWVRLHRAPGRRHPHQRPRGGRRLECDREAHRPARIQGQGARRRQAERHRGAEDRRDQPSHRQAGWLDRRARSASGWSHWARRSASRTRPPRAS